MTAIKQISALGKAVQIVNMAGFSVTIDGKNSDKLFRIKNYLGQQLLDEITEYHKQLLEDSNY